MIKRRGGSEIRNLTPNHKSLESRGQMRFNWSVLYTIGNIFSRDIKYCPCIFKINLIWERYEHSMFWDNKVLVSGLPLRSPGKKWHLDVVPTERHKIYYREGNGASSQRLQVVWNLCLKLFLLNSSHHFHLTCINCLLFLVVHVDIILNSRLWVRPSPVP